MSVTIHVNVDKLRFVLLISAISEKDKGISVAFIKNDSLDLGTKTFCLYASVGVKRSNI